MVYTFAEPVALCSLLWVVKSMLAALVGLWHRGLQKRAADMHELLRHSVQMMGILSQVCVLVKTAAMSHSHSLPSTI
jgi:hypothetical protein